VTATNGVPVGAVLGSAIHPAGLTELSRLCEQSGFSELWLAEDYFFTGGVAGAAAVLAATEHVPVGLSIVSSVARHPALLAMEMSTLAHLHPGRLRIGVGGGLAMWLRQMGIEPTSSLAAIRECVTATQRLLAGEQITEQGRQFSFDAVQLAFPVDDAPVYMGVIGPKMLQLAGEIADGTIGSAPTCPEYVSWAREQIAVGQQRSGRSDAHPFRSLSLFSCHPDGDVARGNARGPLGFYMSATGLNALSAAYGIDDELSELLQGDPATFADRMPDRWVDDLVICGTPAECAAKIDAQLDAGADSVSLFPVPADEAAEQFALAAAEVFPLLRTR
jgi:alkanesulfonate monooxygenase SsuD/methylene tetrahydromethanopterin reductase-like flavin-dependent oxidoreductase (luciferase family)